MAARFLDAARKVEIGVDLAPATDVCPAPPVATEHEVSKDALSLLGRLLGAIGCEARAGAAASLGLEELLLVGEMEMGRPVPAVVQDWRSGQLLHVPLGKAVPSPALPKEMATVLPAGHVTDPAAKSILKRSLGKKPAGRDRRLYLYPGVDAIFVEVGQACRAISGVAVDGKGRLLRSAELPAAFT